MAWGNTRLVNPEDAREGLQLLRNILDCDYLAEGVEKRYLDTAEVKLEMVSRNKRWWQACHWSTDPTFLRRLQTVNLST